MDARPGEFRPGWFSDVPLYNIQAVAAATGVPSITLRSWERRYGVPRPKRDPKGYRLYSDRDIAVTRWLRERVRQGVGISRAVNMLRMLEAGDLGVDVAQEFDFTALQQRLLDAIDRLDEATIAQVVSEALVVASVEDVALSLLQPVLYRVGEMWASGDLSVTSEHVGSNLIRAHLAQLVRLTPRPLRSERILVGAAPGELHDIGPLILTLFLRRRGFDVIFAGASVEPEALRRDVARLRPDAVCLSASGPPAVGTLQELFETLAGEYDGVLGFGGRAFNQDDTAAQRVRGLFLGPDAETAAGRLEEQMAR